MLDHDGHGCDSIGRSTALWCAGAGALVAGLIIAPGLSSLLRDVQYHILVGLFALFFGAAFLGKKTGMYLCNKGNRLWICVVLGWSVAFGSIAIAVLTGSILSILSHGVRNATELLNVLLGPLLLVFLFGGIPALVLGGFYGCIVNLRVAKLDQPGQA